MFFDGVILRSLYFFRDVDRLNASGNWFNDFTRLGRLFDWGFLGRDRGF